MDSVLTTVLLWNNCVVKNQFQYVRALLPFEVDDSHVLTTEFKVMSIFALQFQVARNRRPRERPQVRDVVLRSRFF